MKPVKFGVGQSVRRVEDARFITGAGRYIADAAPANTLHAAVLRSPHPHARFTITDVETARAMPGVRLILTGAETADMGPMPSVGRPKLAKGESVHVPDYPVLARDEVRHVGDAVAFVVAETLWQARDAAEAIAIDYEPLDHIIDARAALAPGALKVWPEKPDNLVYRCTIGDEAKTAKGFAKADRVVELTVRNQRLVTNYLETRGVVGEYDAAADRITLTLGSQGSHTVRDALADKVLKIPRERLRVVTPDVGGGFGTKIFPYREYPLVARAVDLLKAPVTWIADRTEHFLGDAHGRDNYSTARLALDARGRFLALEVETIADLGAYLSYYAPFIPYVGATMLTGVYDILACHLDIRAVHTNTVPVDAYRGAGRPEAAYLIERLVDAAAREIGMDPVRLRKLNFVKPKAMPYRTATGRTYDTGEFAGHLDAALLAIDAKGFKARRKASAKAGRLRGLGVACYIEACGGGAPEPAYVKLEADGTVTVRNGMQSTGQGHQTAYAQLVSQHLELPMDRIRVLQGDTDETPTGGGTGGSRSIPVGGAGVAAASRQLADNLKEMGARALETGLEDVEIADGAVRIAGTDRMIAFADIARSGFAVPEKLETTGSFAPPEATYPNGTHAVEIEVDPDTGSVTFCDYAIVDDFGVTLNPLLLAGQVHGGIVQGIGQALMENTVFEVDSGQLITASLMDYALPRAADVPSFRLDTRNVPSTTNALGVKGAGEAGTIGACPAVINALIDALSHAHGIREIDMPATPLKIWQTIEEAKRRHTL